jgi:hypothetical protein
MDDLQRKTPGDVIKTRRQALTVFLLGFGLAAGIIFSNPIIFGGDPLNRLLHRDKFVMGHQLPMLQVLIFAVTKISPDPALVRYLVAFIGGMAGVGFYWVVTDLFGEKWALPAALLFVSNPFFLAQSTVPYQEGLMLAGLLFAFHFFYTERWLFSSLFLAMACLTRYEAWAAGPVLALTYVLRKDRSAMGWLRAGALFGWMPVLWILANRGLSSRAHFVVESTISIFRLERYIHLGWIVVRNTQLPVLALAAVGGWWLLRNYCLIDWRMWVQGSFVGLFLIAVPFSAHGVPPDPERYVTPREAFIPIYFVLLLATIGLSKWPRWTKVIVVLSVALGAVGGYWYVWRETHQPEVQLAYRLAKYLDDSMQQEQRALVLARPIDKQWAQNYLDKVRETRGDEAWQDAQHEIQELGTAGTDFQRVRAHSHLSRDRLLDSPTGCAEWVAVWSDYPDAAQEVAIGQEVEVLRSPPLSIAILRRICTNPSPASSKP